jgi:hypothetical protein
VTDTAATLSIVKLFMNADPVVKGVLLLLLTASVWSWAVIIDKLWRLGAASRSARARGAGRRRALAARAVGDRGAGPGRPRYIGRPRRERG